MDNLDKLVADSKALGHRVMSAKVAGVETIYRSINRAEFREIQKKLTEKTESLGKNGSNGEGQALAVKDEGEEMLVVKAVLSPSGLAAGSALASLPAGFVPAVAELIMEASGFGGEVAPKEL